MKMKRASAVLSAALLSATAGASGGISETDDFAGMDTVSAEAVSFWDVSAHPPLTNTVVSAALSAADTVDTRRVGSDSDAIDAFDSRFLTVGEAVLPGILRSNPPKGTCLIFR